MDSRVIASTSGHRPIMSAPFLKSTLVLTEDDALSEASRSEGVVS